MSDVVNITINETNQTVDITINETTDDVTINITDSSDTVSLVLEEVGVKGDPGNLGDIDGGTP